MKRYLLVFSFVLMALNVTAQLAIINDPDGFVNVREGKGINTAIVGKLYTDQVFLFNDEVLNDKWVQIYFDNNSLKNYPVDHIHKTNGCVQGFIYRTKAISLIKLPRIKTRRVLQNSITIENDSIRLIVATQPFNAKRHVFKNVPDDCINCKTKTTHVEKIDGKRPIGVDGGLPEVEIKNIILTINNKNIEIPVDSYNDLYQPNLQSLNVYFGKNNNIYLYMDTNSDAAGSYGVLWVIRNKKLIERYIDNAND